MSTLIAGAPTDDRDSGLATLLALVGHGSASAFAELYDHYAATTYPRIRRECLISKTTLLLQVADHALDAERPRLSRRFRRPTFSNPALRPRSPGKGCLRRRPAQE